MSKAPPGPAEHNVHAELIAGLRAPSPYISPKFLYDSLGSKLFEAICELPEYYPTRTEAEIFRHHGEQIAQACGTGATLVDLGAANCAKAAKLFPLLRPTQYVAVDISSEFVQGAVAQLRHRFKGVDMQAVGQDFSAGFALPDTVGAHRRLFFYPGSSIGNFRPDEAVDFLTRLRAQCDADGGLLIGIDLIKDPAVLADAYDDALGVTAAFNLNILRHVSRLIGANFDVSGWRHRSFYNAQRQRVEMHLEARENVSVRWQGGMRYFVRGQSIHTENSHKYTLSMITNMLERTGWRLEHVWTDPKEWFALAYARPAQHFAAGAR
ncbi:L-histidine N(alpha)-methyltransferase [Massilia sp. LXY-6]|uniref:L-histidine N(alpha)-methyltransferase n=1 Tax=Massilia sp. LXY-6 TaxID=3379823 RepID=UPI003EDF0DAD